MGQGPLALSLASCDLPSRQLVKSDVSSNGQYDGKGYTGARKILEPKWLPWIPWIAWNRIPWNPRNPWNPEIPWNPTLQRV